MTTVMVGRFLLRYTHFISQSDMNNIRCYKMRNEIQLARASFAMEHWRHPIQQKRNALDIWTEEKRRHFLGLN